MDSDDDNIVTRDPLDVIPCAIEVVLPPCFVHVTEVRRGKVNLK